MKLAIFFLSVLSCVACASSGTTVSQATATSFKEGITTEADVRKTLGQPQGMTIAANHHHILTYVGSHAHATAATYVPVVGLLAGGAKANSTAAVFDFDENGKLASMNYSTGNSDLHTGLLNQTSSK